MSYLNNTPNGVLYIGRVKWGSDYKHTMLFENTASRDAFFKKELKLIKSNFIYANKNGYIDVDSKIQSISSYNYVFFKNDSDISSHWYCCFINDYEYIVPETTRLYIELDVIQTYIYSTSFQRCIIKRAHISKSDDVVGQWLDNEPVGSSTPTAFKTLASDTFDWTPKWVIHSTSQPVGDGTGAITKFNYGGLSSDDGTYLTGEYGVAVGESDIRELAKWWSKDLDKVFKVDWNKVSQWFLYKGADTGVTFNSAEFFDHSKDVIGVFARPSWSVSGIWQRPNIVAPYCDLALDKSTLACGYVPDNKKLLTSLCNVFQLHNQSGITVNLKPELCTQDYLRIQVQANSMDTSGYKLLISRYKDLSICDIDAQYSGQTALVYDENQGLNKTINLLTSAVGIAGSIPLGAVNPAVAVSTASSSATTFFSALSNVPRSTGSNGNLLSIKPEFQKLKLIQISPSLEECKAIDDYLSMFGYAINQIYAPRSFFNTRSNWNYIQTEGLNCIVPAPSIYAEKMKSIFNSGITLWHTYEDYGDYSKSNI